MEGNLIGSERVLGHTAGSRQWIAVQQPQLSEGCVCAGVVVVVYIEFILSSQPP